MRTISAPCPICGRGCAARSMRRRSRPRCCGAKLHEHGARPSEVPITEVPLSGKFSVPPFDLELITLTHSIPEPNAVVIRTPAGNGAPHRRLEARPRTRWSAMSPTRRPCAAWARRACWPWSAIPPTPWCDGQSGSEAEVRDSLHDLVGKMKNRVAVACFASNVARVETIAKVAAAHDRHVALVGRSLWRIAAGGARTTAISPICRPSSPSTMSATCRARRC